MDTNELHEICQEAAERGSREKLLPLWEHAGVSDPAYPVETQAVIELVQRCDYVCDGDFIQGLVNSGTLPVPLVSGRRKWSALNVFTLVLQLEGRRRWKLSPLHIHKMSALERLDLQARAEGHDSALTDLDAFDVESLLVMMAECETASVRHAIHIAIKAKMRLGETL